MLIRMLCFVCFVGFASAASAGDTVRPFVVGSLAKMLDARPGRPLIVTFWSLSCTYCPAELKALGKLAKAMPRLEIVVVATDPADQAPLAAQTLAGYGVDRAEQWIFADDMPERLRFDIARSWHGELPRTHLYDRDHRLEVVAGIVPEPRLVAWARANAR